jgi:predicted transcriptional regulator of viral defense system
MEDTDPSPRLAGLSTRERQIMGALAATGAPAITAADIVRAASMSRTSANLTISRLHRKGWLNRVRRGVYAIVPIEATTPQPAVELAWPLAMDLFSPCFISGWSAAEHWDFTEQIFNSIAVVTGHRQRSALQVLAGVTFRTRTIPKTRMFGTTTVWFGSRRAEVADPHRLLIDILDAPEFGGGGRHTLDIVRAYWKSEHCNPATLLDYAKRYGRGSVFKRMGFTAERFGRVSDAWLDECRRQLSAGVIRFDPSTGKTGRIITRWRLRMNVPDDAA